MQAKVDRFMIKLSKSGWNNIIIFAVMGFILMINVTNKNVFAPHHDNQADIGDKISIIEENAVVLTLTINNVIHIERIGRHWRAQPDKISAQALEQMMMSWQQSNGELVADVPQFDRKLALNVKLGIAGRDEFLTLSFYATDSQLLVFHHSAKQWLAMPIVLYNQLFPHEIFL